MPIKAMPRSQRSSPKNIEGEPPCREPKARGTTSRRPRARLHTSRITTTNCCPIGSGPGCHELARNCFRPAHGDGHSSASGRGFPFAVNTDSSHSAWRGLNGRSSTQRTQHRDPKQPDSLGKSGRSTAHGKGFSYRRAAVSASSFGPTQPSGVLNCPRRASTSSHAACSAIGSSRASSCWIGLAELRTNST